MTTMEYGRHVRRILEWDEVEIEVDDPTPRMPVDLTHGSVFVVEEEDESAPASSLLTSVARLFGRR
ncbi:hypothetical protein HNQ07_003062 [Deinococcus metalli]|uniref:Uncharacterized protein n=1 Tax=Deinococcus metalli TaxID=1141878 RepID=A0A7W8NR61_9DEIO|nr:hypothetical protein [Deinococcus metalli]MBB5377570.1 hypothetical protein [Deinococcus metalli]GHF51432.1 hypothetical protein GCM10017781_29980 [Deinococcus metalli]